MVESKTKQQQNPNFLNLRLEMTLMTVWDT